jgi:hypothetical protein
MSVDNNNKLRRALVASFHEYWNCAANLKPVFVVARTPLHTCNQFSWLREPRRKLEINFRGCGSLAVRLKSIFVVAGTSPQI